MRRIGIFGGTFDPIHLGHLMVAQDVHESMSLDRTLFVPAGVPPHRPGGPVLGAEERVALVSAAVHNDSRFEVWDGEVRRGGPSYTVDTVETFGALWPDAELFLTIGADQHAVFSKWHRPDRIRELATVVVVERDGLVAGEVGTSSEKDDRGGSPEPHRRVRTRRVDVSSTEVRERLERGASIRYLVPASVRRIIEDNRWYKSG